MNSDLRSSVDFVVDNHGIKQVYSGYSKHGIGERNEPHLPNIKLDKYTVRSNEFMKSNDDPNSRRFVHFDQFPPNSTKANLKHPRTINFTTQLGQCEALKPKQQFGDVYEVDFKALKGKKENFDTLVPFSKQ